MSAAPRPLPGDVAATHQLLAQGEYLASKGLATALFLALRLQRPLLLEGEPGVGKTEIARVLAQTLQRPLVRLQCYEGLDLTAAAYEWNYSLQMIHIRASEAYAKAAEASGAEAVDRLEQDLFSERFLLERPLLKAINLANQGTPPVLLIDELDRADEPFEAFLLEFLADYQLSIPERGTLHATASPITILTSNRTREVHDAVRRRCIYHWVDYPSLETEREILKLKVPEASEQLSRQIALFVRSLRAMDLYKNPGIAETLTWARALTALDCAALDPEKVSDTIGTLLKYQDDISRVQGSAATQLLDKLEQEVSKMQGRVNE